MLAAVLLLPGLILGCASRQERYCDALEDERGTLAELGESGLARDGTVAATVEVFTRLRDAAPDDLRDEWDTYLVAWQGLQRALDDAGADESMFGAGRRPPGMSEAEYGRVSQAAARLREATVVQAASDIEQHALDVCKVDLSATGSGG